MDFNLCVSLNSLATLLLSVYIIILLDFLAKAKAIAKLYAPVPITLIFIVHSSFLYKFYISFVQSYYL